MIAFMPQSPQAPSLSSLQSSNTSSTSTMSLAILPSSQLSYSDAPMFTSSPTSAKRPKLSLDTTSSLGPFGGKRSTSLRLDTLSATSPTFRNTFSNAYEQGKQVMPQRRPLPLLSTSELPPSIDAKSTSTTPEEDAADTASTSASSVSTADSLPTSLPYKLGYNISSILRNGPLGRDRSRHRSFAQSKPMFPAPKKVNFRAPLTEEVKNKKFTMRHSDIESSSSTISTLELTPSEDKADDGTDTDRALSSGSEDATSLRLTTTTKRPVTDEEDQSTCPVTPVAGRRKKDRQWVWTLGPADNTVRNPNLKQDDAMNTQNGR